MQAEPDASEEADLEHTLMGLYKKCVDAFRWSLREIDDTDLDTLFAFLFHRTKDDPNVRVIKGKTYQRAKQAPAWL